MSDQTPVDKDSPLMKAWETYSTSADFANSKTWARIPAHIEGSLWAAFCQGFVAAKALADADPAASSKEVAIRQFRMDELEAVMLSVDKWLDYAEDDPKKPNPATRACEAREVALRAIEKLQHQLAECYRLTGADPDCNEDWRLAELAVDEVRQLRADCDSEIGMGEERRYRQHKLEAEIDRLKLERAASSEGRATWQRELWQIGIGGNHLANALICLVGSAPWYDDLTELRGWTFDAMLARFGQPVTDMWVAWKAIMDLRDAIGEFPPAPVDGGR